MVRYEINGRTLGRLSLIDRFYRRGVGRTGGKGEGGRGGCVLRNVRRM